MLYLYVYKKKLLQGTYSYFFIFYICINMCDNKQEVKILDYELTTFSSRIENLLIGLEHVTASDSMTVCQNVLEITKILEDVNSLVHREDKKPFLVCVRFTLMNLVSFANKFEKLSVKHGSFNGVCSELHSVSVDKSVVTIKDLKKSMKVYIDAGKKSNKSKNNRRRDKDTGGLVDDIQFNADHIDPLQSNAHPESIRKRLREKRLFDDKDLPAYMR